MKNTLKGFLAILVMGALIYGCGQANSQGAPQAPAPVAVNTIQVSKQAVTSVDTYPATVVPVSEVDLRPQVSGYITNIFVKDGETVSKGQRLYEIDRTKYEAAYAQAKANVSTAEANLQRVKKDLERYEALHAKDAIASQQVDYARIDLQTAEAQVAAAKAQLASAATDLNYSVIKAPFPGTIGIHQVRLGTQVSPGQPLLNTLSADDPIAVDFVINEREIPRFNRLKKGTQPDSLFTLALSDGSVYPFTGEIAAMDRAVGRQTGTITVRLNFDNPNRDLVPGMTLTARVLNQDYGKQIVIPYKSVTEQMGEYFVYVNQDGKAHQVRVGLGTILGSDVVVRNGLQENQTIVVDGLQRIREGAPIQSSASSN